MGILAELVQENGGLLRARTATDPARLGAEVQALEALQMQTGAPAVDQDTPGLGRKLIDLISRPNYMAAGIFEEIMEGTPEESLGRAFRELFSGVGGIQGDKEAFAEVLEQQGVGKLGSVHVPIVSNYLGEFTGRGALGLGMDIFFDPLTYLGGAGAARSVLTKAGGKAVRKKVSKMAMKRYSAEVAKSLPKNATPEVRDAIVKKADQWLEDAVEAGGSEWLEQGGIYWMGRRVAGSPIKAIVNSGLSNKIHQRLLKTATGRATLGVGQSIKESADRVGEMFGNMFVPGFGARNLPDFMRSRKDMLNAAAVRRDTVYTVLEDIGLHKIPEKDWKKFTTAIDEGKIGTLSEPYQAMAREVEKLNKKMFGDEVKMDVMNPASFRTNYIPHFYEMRHEEMEAALMAHRARKAAKGTITRHSEERVFNTFKEALEHNKAHPELPQFNPIWDPHELMRRRLDAHVDLTTWKPWIKRLEAQYGTKGRLNPLGFDPEEAFDLGMRQPELALVETEAIADAIKTGKDASKSLMKRFSPEGKQAYLSARLRNAKSPREALEILDTYKDYDQFLPKQKIPFGTKAPDGSDYVPWKLPRSKQTYELPQTLADHLTSMDRSLFTDPDVKGLLKAYDMITNAFKAGVTIFFPAFHFRNAYSNVAQAFTDIGIEALNPKSYAEAASILAGYHTGLKKTLSRQGREIVETGVFKTKSGLEYSFDEIRVMLKQHGIYVDGNDMLEYAGKKRSRLGQKITKVPRTVGGVIENESRTQLFLTHLRRGLSPEDAAERVNKVLFDYRDGMTNFERTYMRRAFPFYLWTSRNFALQLNVLRTTPGRAANIIKPIRGRHQENEEMTSWEAGALKMRLDGDGRTVRMITGVDVPIRNLDLLWQGGLKKSIRGIMGMVNPLVKAPIEVATGTNLFLGRPLGRKQSESVGRAIESMGNPAAPLRKWLMYAKRYDDAGRPRYSFDGERFYLLFQSWMFSRVVSTTDRQFREYMDDSAIAGGMLDMLTGLRMKDMNLAEEQVRKLRERKGQLERSLVRRGVGYEFQKQVIPNEEKLSQLELR